MIHLRQGEPQNVVLPQLTPNTEYKYRLQVREPGSDGFVEEPERSFHTQRAPDAPFVFAVQADSHLDLNTVPPLYTRTLNNIAAEHPDFLVDLGDTFMTGKYGDEYTKAQAQYLAQRYYFGLVDGSIPLLLTLGNHDGKDGGRGGVSADSPAVWANAMRKRYFPNPVPDEFYTGNDRKVDNTGLLEDYYAWKWGDALFIVLDPFWPTTGKIRTSDDLWNRTLGRGQYEWLRRTLESSKEPFKFVFIHHLVGGADKDARGGAEAAPYYEWGGHDPDGADAFSRRRPGWEAPIHQLLARSGVSVVFHGHDHIFAKQDLDGVVYQEVPQPGHRQYNKPRGAEEYGYTHGDILGGTGHLCVTVSGGEARLDYILSCLPEDEGADRRNGQIAYSYTLPAGPGISRLDRKSR
ncbi:MAG: metallophosphoesterase [Candidatus Sumerlaeota bacterium]|nr:metallophosphoesterase [Candidatus Sumerlaeota bacterium]